MNWIKSHKKLTVVIAVIVLIIAISASGGGKTKDAAKTNSSKPQPQSSQPTTQPKQVLKPQPTVPTYTLVGEYGQGGKVYVISPNDATEVKLTLIGKDLNNKFGSDSFARISIFTVKRQAEILANNPLDAANLEGAAADAYDKAFVAQFNVNKSTGLKQFFVMLNGKQKDIKL